jgi:hypothetical protein
MMKPFTLGIVAMAAKPPHAGHVRLLELACKECDVAYAFVSTADRARPGELEVTWAQVEPTWVNDIVPSMPDNFKFVPTREAPVRKAYELIEQADPKWRIALYGRADGELSQRFRNMPQNVTIRDVTLGDYSGTAVRKAIAAGDYEAFREMMAPQVDAKALWERLVGGRTVPSRASRSTKQAQRSRLP